MRWDDPVPGFRSVPGVLEAGSGAPRDGLRLVVTEVIRGGAGKDSYSDRPDEARVTLRLEELDGKPLDSARWRILDPGSVTLEGTTGVYGSVYSSAGMDFETVNGSGELFVSLCSLPSGEVHVRRMVLDVPVLPVQPAGRLRWTLERGQDLGVTFLDQILFVEFERTSVSWGSHARGRHNPPRTIGTCLQGVLEEFKVLDSRGKEPPMSYGTGRSWGWTHHGSLREGEESCFPWRVEARWRPCGPTVTCRFVVEDVRIPAPGRGSK